MTQDFIQDLDEALTKEGYKFFIAITKDGEAYEIRSSINELPKMVTREDKPLPISRTEDFLDAARVILDIQSTEE